MSDEVSRLADQLERGYRGDAWHGTPLRALLANVKAATAAAHPVPRVHSIWELTQHITFWLDVVRRRLTGEVLELADGDDWQPVPDATPAHWHETLTALEASHDRLRAAVRALSPGDLERIVPVKGYTNYVMLHGVLQHNLYHAGQIAMLLRASRPE